MKLVTRLVIAGTAGTIVTHAGAAVAAPKMTQVSVGLGGACGIQEDGTVICWGENRAFDIDGGIAKTPRRMGKLAARMVSIGRHHACALDKAGAVHCAGQDDVTAIARGAAQDLPDDAPDPGSQVWQPIPGVPKAKAVISGGFHACVLTSTDDVVCWGTDMENRTGHAGSDPKKVAGLGPTKAVVASEQGTCALGADRKVRCFGQLYLGDKFEPQKKTVTLPLPPSISVAMDDGWVCGLGENGKTVTCIGSLDRWLGQEAAGPVAFELPERARSLVSGGFDLCAEGESGKLWCTGFMGALLVRTGKVEPRVFRAYPGTAASWAVSSFNVCRVTKEGGLECAGDDEVLPDAPPREQRSAAAVVGLEGVVQIASGNSHACARRDDGTVSCWGGSWEDGAIPKKRPGLTDAVDITAGGDTACAKRKSGEIVCWQPEQVQNQPRVIPAPKTRFDTFTLGDGHGCGITGGEVRCWGDAYHGALGFLSPDEYPKPVDEPRKVPGVDSPVSVDAGSFATCALTKNGDVSCWGMNEEGQLGRGTKQKAEKPARVVNLTTATKVAVGNRFACALGKDKRAACWGGGALTPIPWPGAADVIDVAVGAGNRSARWPACIVHETGTVECGAPGTSRLVKGVTKAKAVSVGDQFACALVEGGKVGCWGRRDYGQLGDGKPPVTTTPVPIVMR